MKKLRLTKNKLDAETDPSIEEKGDSAAIKEKKRFFNRKKKDKVEATEVEDTPTTKYIKLPKEKKSNRKAFKIFIVIFIILAILTTLIVYTIVLPAQRIYASVNVIQQNLNSISNDFKNKDLSNIDVEFKNIQNELTRINNEIDHYQFLATINETKGYYQNFQIIRGILKKTDTLLSTTLPELKNLLKVTGFKTDKTSADAGVITPVDLSASGDKKNGAVSLVMKELPQYLALYNKIEPQVLDIFQDVKKIDVNYVPNIGSHDFKDQLKNVDDIIDQYPTWADKAKSFLSYVPQLIGSNKPVKFLIILQNETEMRASGGLLTAYGNMEIKDGEFGDMFMSDMWNIELYISNTLGIDVGYRNIYGQDYLMNHGCGSSYLRAQDSGIYPDLNVTMNMFKNYYDTAKTYDPISYPDYDYVVILNNSFAETLIGLVQPLQVDGFGEVTADKLYDLIKSQTDDPKYYGDPNRKSVIKVIADAAKTKLMDLSIVDVPKVVGAILKSFQAKDIALASPKDPNMQKFFDTYGMSGKTVKDYTGDYFQLNEAQNCSLKLNRWVRDSVMQNVYIFDNGNINKDVHVHWIQPQIYDASLDAQYSASLVYSYRAWVRMFLPNGTQSINSDGYDHSGYLYYNPKDYHDAIMDKNVSDNIIQFDHRRFTDADPIDKQDLNVSYELPDSINYNKDGKYTMIVQKHPGKSWGEQYTINVHDKDNTYTIKFTLDRDKILTYKNGVISVDNYDKSLDWITELMNKVPWDKIKK